MSERRRAGERIRDAVQQGLKPTRNGEDLQSAAQEADGEPDEQPLERMQILEGIGRGEMAVERGRVMPHDEARSRMRRWLK